MEGIDKEQRNVEELATRIEELNAELKALEKARKDTEAQETAKEMGVKKRTDPNQSIVGGSHYFHKIFKRLPASVPLSDRVWMSLAAYNVGFKHLKDARNLTLDSGRDPNDWKEVSKSLIYILDERFQTDDSKNNKRSQETLDYVNKVKLFYRTLSLLEQTAFSFSSS